MTDLHTGSHAGIPEIDIALLRSWIGRAQQQTDLVTATPLAALAATLDRDDGEPTPGFDVPPLWHWLFFLPTPPQHDIGPDGHAHRGDFLPPVPLPRRMWAGGRVSFTHPLQVGDEVTRVSRIAKVDVKQGRSGPLVFVTVRHEITNARGLAVSEEHDIVFREAASAHSADLTHSTKAANAHAAPATARPDAAKADPAPASAPAPAPTDPSFERRITPDPVLLFRYSALTFNGHRIHYDRPYATQVEDYPGLVVHGPLIATLLLDLLRRQLSRQMPHLTVRRFAYKAVRPLFDTHPFTVCGRPEPQGGFTLWAQDHDGQLAMQASVETS